ncbi:MAG: general secretion pathway protein GspK [Planctomycetales bacterium]|nr:general secretion pathway protein GspK [Planctomycetales bacterium]
MLVVLVVVVLLALGAYTFAEFMVLEAEATNMYGRSVQTRAFADSGIELASSMLAQRADSTPESYFHNPSWFQGVLMRDAASPRGIGRFSLVAPFESDPAARTIRFGLIDESSKLNLNSLLKLGVDDTTARNMLMQISGMTEEIADAILDWIDPDDTSREFGAESEYYLTLNPPYEPTNGPLQSFDELLLVRGMTPWLLFGEDANRNGLLDPNENDGELRPPLDDGDGLLQHGLSAYLTIFSREMNQQLDGEARINVNGNTLTDVYDQLVAEFDEDVANFVVAYRLFGPQQAAGGTSTTSGTGQQASTPSSSPTNTRTSRSPTSGGSSAAGTGGSAAGTGGSAAGTGSNSARTGSTVASGQGTGQGSTAAGAQQLQQLAGAAANAMTAAAGGQVTRGGMDLTRGGQNQIKSLYDLVGAQVKGTVSGVQNVEIANPWPDDPNTLRSSFPDVLEKMTTRADKFIEGRVNVNQARREILLGLPGMSEELATAIVGAQMIGASGAVSSESSERSTTAWLLFNSLATLEEMRQLDPYITARGDVFRTQVVGYFDAGGPASRLEVVIDASQQSPQVIFLRDLTELGRGYSSALLTLGAE